MIAATCGNVSRSRRSTRTSERTREPRRHGTTSTATSTATSPSAGTASTPLPAAGLLRFLPPREPRRERLRFGRPSAFVPAAPSASSSRPRPARRSAAHPRLGCGFLARCAGSLACEVLPCRSRQIGRWHVDSRRRTAVLVARCARRAQRRHAGAAAAGFLRLRPPLVPRRVRFFFVAPSALTSASTSRASAETSVDSLVVLELVLDFARPTSRSPRQPRRTAVPSCSATRASASRPPPRT